MPTINQYNDIPLVTEDGQFQLMVDYGLTGNYTYVKELHAHTCYELFYIVEGSLEIVCSNGSIHLSEDTLLVIPPEVLHYSWKSDTELQRYSLFFHLSKLSPSVPFHHCFHDMTPVTFRNPSDIQNAFLRLVRYYREESTVRQPLMASCFYEILYLIKKELLMSGYAQAHTHTSLRSSNASNEYRNYVIDDYFNQNFTGDMSLKTLAEMVHMSERQLNRIIHANYGQSFAERVVFLRMQNAAKLLTETDMTVKSIAAAVGYKSTYGFYLSFEKTYGMTPDVYRKSSFRKDFFIGT